LKRGFLGYFFLKRSNARPAGQNLRRQEITRPEGQNPRRQAKTLRQEKPRPAGKNLRQQEQTHPTGQHKQHQQDHKIFPLKPLKVPTYKLS
jgi:hypothetical protein